MKLILLQDVRALGKASDIVEVSDGYARNKLLPGKLAVEATDKNRNELKLRQKNEEKKAAERLAEARDLSAKLSGVKIVVSMKAGKDGKAFGSVSSKEIAEEAKKQFGLDLDKKKIQLAEPIKTFGTHEVAIKLHPEVTGKFSVQVKEQ